MAMRQGWRQRKNTSTVNILPLFIFIPGSHAKEKIIRIKVPDWLQLDIREFNFEGYKVTKQKTQEKGATVYTFQTTKYTCT